MEQDLNILERMLKIEKECLHYDVSQDEIRALEHLIKAYKELEEERQIVGMPVRNKRDGRIGIVLHQWKSGSVAVLESINPRVINTHDSWNTLEIVTDEVKQTQTKCETIPVSLVEETIEELNKLLEEDLQDERKVNSNRFIIICQCKNCLQELLEKRKYEYKKDNWESPSIRADNLIEEIRKNTWGKSLTVPNGWVRPKDIVEIMKELLEKR